MNERHSMAGVVGVLQSIGWRPGGIIDIGVEMGTPGLHAAWPEVPRCLIEPSPDCLPFMQKIAETYPGTTIFNVGASDRKGKMAVTRHRAKVNIFFGVKANWLAATVPVRTCDDMVAEAALPAPYLYKLDTDSHELEILRGSRETLKHTDVAIVELNTFYGLSGLATPAEIWRTLDEAGFAFFDIGDGAYGQTGVMRAADVVFVRRESDLFAAAYEQSAKAMKANKWKRKFRGD